MSNSDSVNSLQVKFDQEPTEKHQGVLKILLADESVLDTKLRNYRWNILEVKSYSVNQQVVEGFRGRE